MKCLLSRCSAVGSAHGLGPWCRRFESYHLDHKKHYTIWYGAFYFVQDDDFTYLQALLELGSPSEWSRCKLACNRRTKCYEQFIAKSSYHFDQKSLENLAFSRLFLVNIRIFGLLILCKYSPKILCFQS